MGDISDTLVEIMPQAGDSAYDYPGQKYLTGMVLLGALTMVAAFGAQAYAARDEMRALHASGPAHKVEVDEYSPARQSPVDILTKNL